MKRSSFKELHKKCDTQTLLPTHGVFETSGQSEQWTRYRVWTFLAQGLKSYHELIGTQSQWGFHQKVRSVAQLWPKMCNAIGFFFFVRTFLETFILTEWWEECWFIFIPHLRSFFYSQEHVLTASGPYCSGPRKPHGAGSLSGSFTVSLQADPGSVLQLRVKGTYWF